MSGKAGYYSVIQYCPDRGREECANVGVLVFVPDEPMIRAKVARTPRRARQFFDLKRDEMTRLSGAMLSFERFVNNSASDITTVADLERFILTRANDIRVTAPRLMKIHDLATDLNELYRDLVEAEQAANSTGDTLQVSLFAPVLNETLVRLSREGKIRQPGRVRVPMMARILDIPYAYQNGVLNLVKPQVFETGRKTENRASQLAVEGQLLQKHPEGGDRRLIVVSGERSSAEGEAHAGGLLREFNVRFVRKEEAIQFAQEVEAQAH